MITVLENSLTKKKHTLNLVDHKGRVLGFNPYPNDEKISWELCIENNAVAILSDKDIAIEKYIVGAPFHFGSDITLGVDPNTNKVNGLNVELISDNLSTVNYLYVFGSGGEYYCDDIGLSNEDVRKLFSAEEIAKWKNGRWSSHYRQFYSDSKWDNMNLLEKTDLLHEKVEKLESKVELLEKARH